MGFDLVAQDEIGARVAAFGLVELVAEGGEGLAALGRGERIEPDEQLARAGQMSPEAVSASRVSAYASSPVKVQQNTSDGTWRTLLGLADFAVVQSYLSTAAAPP